MEIMGIEPGARVGELLEKLNKAQISGEVKLKREAREYLKNIK